MKLLRAMAASFSLYSRFPTPRFQWTEDDFRRCLVFLPCVGLAIGAIILGVAALFNVVEIPLIGRMAILSAMPVSEVKKAIMFEDVDMITRANGIGKKTAQKIVFELKDKIGTVVAEEQGYQLNEILPEAGSNKDSAIEALMGLGFSRAEAAESLKGVTDEDLSVEDYIKQALKNRG